MDEILLTGVDGGAGGGHQRRWGKKPPRSALLVKNSKLGTASRISPVFTIGSPNGAQPQFSHIEICAVMAKKGVDNGANSILGRCLQSGVSR